MIIFQSDASADVMMFDPVARQMMAIMGKEVSERGVITPEQMPGCIARLQGAIDADRARAVPQGTTGDDASEAGQDSAARPVTLTQRAVPLIELLQRSHQRNKPVLWGV